MTPSQIHAANGQQKQTVFKTTAELLSLSPCLFHKHVKSIVFARGSPCWVGGATDEFSLKLHFINFHLCCVMSRIILYNLHKVKSRCSSYMIDTPLDVKDLGAETHEHCVRYTPNRVMQLKQQNVK